MNLLNNISSRNSNVSCKTLIKLLSKQRKGLNIVHINAQSLVNKMDEFRFIFENSGTDIICISETWFDKIMPDSLFALSGYKLFRADRESHAGGVAIFIRNCIPCKLNCKSTDNSAIEYIFVEIMSNSEKLLVGAVYRPNKQTELETLLGKLHCLCLCYANIVISGDFNSNVLKDSFLVSEMLSLGIPIVDKIVPTHFSPTVNTLLDLFFIDDLKKRLLYDQISCPIFTNHDLIFLTYDF